MVTTTLDMYNYFLDGIEKSYTGVVIPELWNRIINDWAQLPWFEKNLSIEQGSELTEKQIQDLEKLRVVTDGIYQYNGVNIAPLVVSNNVVEIPKYTQSLQSINGVITYPRLERILKVSVKLLCAKDECFPDGLSDWQNSSTWRSDQEAEFMDSPYRKPKSSRIYHELIEGKLRFLLGTTCQVKQLKLSYYRYPQTIFYNEANPTDTGNPLTGSVTCELAYAQKIEILDEAIRIFLERIKDDRYKSFFNEQNLKNNSLK